MSNRISVNVCGRIGGAVKEAQCSYRYLSSYWPFRESWILQTCIEKSLVCPTRSRFPIVNGCLSQETVL